jgi:hypothetical protein
MLPLSVEDPAFPPTLQKAALNLSAWSPTLMSEALCGDLNTGRVSLSPRLGPFSLFQLTTG